MADAIGSPLMYVTFLFSKACSKLTIYVGLCLAAQRRVWMCRGSGQGRQDYKVSSPTLFYILQRRDRGQIRSSPQVRRSNGEFRTSRKTDNADRSGRPRKEPKYVGKQRGAVEMPSVRTAASEQ